MKFSMVMASLASLLFGAGAAYAAATSTLSIIVTIQAPPSTSISCGNKNTYTLASPAAGTVVCPLQVQPSDWQGAITVTQTSGPQANAFTVNGNNLVVGSAPLTQAGTYALTLSAAP